MAQQWVGLEFSIIQSYSCRVAPQTPPSLSGQEQDEGEINESDNHHIVLEMKTKDIQTHISSYLYMVLQKEQTGILM